jgi:hypothetical protein
VNLRERLEEAKATAADQAERNLAAFAEKAERTPLWHLVLQRPRDGRYTTLHVWAANRREAEAAAPTEIARLNKQVSCPRWFSRVPGVADDHNRYYGPVTVKGTAQVCPYCLRPEHKHSKGCCSPQGFTLPAPTTDEAKLRSGA